MGDAGFIVSVNEQPFCTYAFRLPLDDVRALVVQGDLQTVTQIDHRRVFPVARPTLTAIADVARLEFSNDMPVGYMAGHIIVLTAMPYGHPNGWFEMRFMDASGRRQLFHFNVRFDDRGYGGTVVRNAQTEELRWLNDEERHGGFPFVLNEQFTMAVAFGKKELRVAIGGVEFCTFAYRRKDQLKAMGGLKVYGSFGGHLEVTALDHVTGGASDCVGYEQCSAPEGMMD